MRVRHAGGEADWPLERTAITSQVNDLTSIAALLADWRAAARRPSVLIRTLLDEAAAHNAAGRIYTQILHPRAQRTAERLESPDEPRPYAAQRKPLHGVPIAIKDNIDIAGTETSCGGWPARPPAAADAAIVSLLESLGAVIIGKTNLDEAALGCERPQSSLWPLHQSALCGSIERRLEQRLRRRGRRRDMLCSASAPTHWDRCAFPPRFAASWVSSPRTADYRWREWHHSTQDSTASACSHASLPDIAHAFSALVQQAAPAHPAPGRGGMRQLGCLDEAALAPVQRVLADDYRRCVAALRDAAEFRVTLAPAIDFAAVARAALWEVAHEFAARGVGAVPGHPVSNDAGSALRRLLDRALVRPAAALAAGRLDLQQAAARLDECFASTQAIFTPTCPIAAPGIDEDLPNSVAAFVAPANVAGLPAVCWPQALPERRTLSLQLIGRRGSDAALLDLASRVQGVLDRRFAAAEG
jgi:Asp-tRNA(Asn)/Glu-tRNA(Gln) amidotransferase A subunit family amidase